MIRNFQKLEALINELNKSNKTTTKLEILTKYIKDPFISRIFFYTYNPFYKYYVTPELLSSKYEDDLGKPTMQYTDIFVLLDALRNRKITGHTAIQTVNDFAFLYEDYKDIIYSIIGKDLGIRMGTSLINKASPGLIPEFDVALAVDLDKVDVDFKTRKWYGSRKLDGVRCITIFDNAGNISCWSRQGNQFETLGNLENFLKTLNLTNTVLDGEMCLVDDKGNEQFQGIMSEIRRKNHTIKNPKYLVFDMIPLDDFANKIGKQKFSERYEQLKKLFTSIKSPFIELLEQIQVYDELDLSLMTNKAEQLGWEGIILREDKYYEGKRTKSMIKCKKFKDAEYVIKDCEVGPFRYIVDGVEKTEDMITNVLIEHKGCKVSVGSGFSIDQRIYYREHVHELVGAVATVKYFQETTNKSGGVSLRFPTIKYIHGKKRTT